jgi:hypothetical protein
MATKLKPVSTRLPVPLIKDIKAASESSGVKLELLIAQAISEWLARRKEAAHAEP